VKIRKLSPERGVNICEIAFTTPPGADVRIPKVDITDSLAMNPVISEVETCQLPKPKGAKIGAIKAPIEARIEEIDRILRNAEVVLEDEVDVDVINIGCRVKIFDMEYDEELEYKIVGSAEANSLKGRISNESPLGMALLGKREGDVVDVETHSGTIQYKILEIQKSN